MYIIVYVYVYMHMSVFIFLTKETQSGTRRFHDVHCSKRLTFQQWLKVSILDKSVDMTDHTAVKTA